MTDIDVDICVAPRHTHLEVVASTELVSSTVMTRVIDALARAVDAGVQRRVLLEVVAPKCLVTFADRVQIWTYAARTGLQGLQVAHVITGRPLDPDEGFKEDFAWNRGIRLKTFTDRCAALAWLNGR